MDEIVCASSGDPSKVARTTHRPGADHRPVDEPWTTRDNTVSAVYELSNSTVVVTETANGPVGRVERENEVEWAVLAPETVASLEVLASR